MVYRFFVAPKVTRTHVRKKSLNRVRAFWLLPGALVAVECNLLSISRFLIIGCVFLRTLKYITTCVIAVYISQQPLILLSARWYFRCCVSGNEFDLSYFRLDICYS